MLLLLMLLLSLSSDVYGRSCDMAEISSLRQQLTALEKNENKTAMQLAALEDQANNMKLAALEEKVAAMDAKLDNLIALQTGKDSQPSLEDVRLDAKDATPAQEEAQLDAKDTEQTQEKTQQSLTNKTAELAANTSDISALDLCGHIQYKTDSNPARAASNNKMPNRYHERLCDKDLHGWYRFTHNNQSTTITTSCVPGYHCGTNGAMWLDLEGGRLPQPGEEKQVKVCGSWTICRCTYSIEPITVRNCGAFLLYLINGIPNNLCNRAYCTQN